MNAVDVLVVGSGFSGALVLANLLRTGQPLSIAVAEKSGRFFRGTAYGTRRASHLLNVPAGKMSALSAEPDHFVKWLSQRQLDADASTFAERRVYGDYLSDVVRDSVRASTPSASLQLIPGEVTRAVPFPSGGFVVDANGELLFARVLVLATGNDAPKLPRGVSPDLGPALVADPWETPAFGFEPDAPVFLLGTGLTAVDVLLALRERGHRGPVHALSRRGLLPRAHAEAPVAPVPPPLPLPERLVPLLHAIRAHARASGWRAAIDGLRPHVAPIWARMGEDDRRRFLRHVRPYWDAHRHRMAPDVANAIEEELAYERLVVHAGRLVSATPAKGRGVRVTWSARGTGKTLSLDAAMIVNATGVSNDLRGACSPLLSSLRDAGRLVPDPLGLGLLCDGAGRVLTEQAERQDDLLALGPLRRGLLWESTAVPELREQALDAAERIAETLMGRDLPTGTAL